MIEIKNLSYSYPASRVKVLTNLNLTLANDCIYGLLGKNGMGKSTLLYLISGLLRPKTGEVLFDGANTSLRLAEVLRELYIVPEEYDIPAVTMDQLVWKHRTFYPRFNGDILNSCLADFGMPSNVSLKALSMGQKKKVYMSFAMASGTKVLLMDEPTNGLDIPSKSLFRKVIANNMSNDRTVIISTHQVHDVEQLLDHILILDHSGFKFNASTADIANHYSFEFRQADNMDADIIYAEPSLQGNAVMAKRRANSPETQINLELLFNAVVSGKLSL